MIQTRGITLRAFLRASRSSQSHDAAALMERMVHKALFQALWDECDTSLTRLYATQGHLLQHVFGQEVRLTSARKFLKAAPVVGTFKAKNPVHDDIRFICMLHRDDVVMLSDVAALDSALSGIQRYEKEHECFMPIADGFVEFVTNYDFVMRVPVEVS
jgi:hypothetical protein